MRQACTMHRQNLYPAPGLQESRQPEDKLVWAHAVRQQSKWNISVSTAP